MTHETMFGGDFPSEGLHRLTCGHSEMTAPDGEGYAICAKCGAAPAVRLTRAIFDAAVNAAASSSSQERTPG